MLKNVGKGLDAGFRGGSGGKIQKDDGVNDQFD